MKAYHGLQEVKDKRIAIMRDHMAADELVRGTYGTQLPDGRRVGCAVFCTVGSSRHAAYEAQLGIPRVIARLEDGIFEGLPADRFKEWPIEFLKAIPVGADLSMVWPAFAVWLMTDEEFGVLRLAKSERAKASILAVAGMYSRILAGETVPLEERRKIYKNAAAAASAADAYVAAYVAADADAYAAADAAAYAAAAAAAAAYAYAAAYAAFDAAARQKARAAQADQLLKILRSAPVVDEPVSTGEGHLAERCVKAGA
jgi:hypothetical protein